MHIINNNRTFSALKFLPLLFVITVSHLSTNAQAAEPIFASTPILKNETKALNIGDKVPDITFENVLNYKNKKAKLSDFRNKLIILDMWSINCTSCIAAFPKMEALQNKFADKIQILLVNPHDIKYDSEDKIKYVLDKLKVRTGYYPTLPIPIHDSILNKYFPHESVPHEIWINGEGKVEAITGSNDVSEENIQALLDGKVIKIPVKNDWAFDRKKPLLSNDNSGISDDFIYRSVFTGYKEGVGFGSGVRLNEKRQVIGLYMLNKPLRLYINEAYRDVLNKYSKSTTIFDVRNRDQFKDEFNSAYSYCYDLTLPATPWKKLQKAKYLKEDLNRFFKILVTTERRKLRCLILTSTNRISKSLTKYQKSEFDLKETSIKKFIHNYSINQTIKLLESHFDKPLIDETRVKKNIDIDFPNNFKLSDREIIAVLQNLGFSIREEEREIEVVIISDKTE